MSYGRRELCIFLNILEVQNGNGIPAATVSVAEAAAALTDALRIPVTCPVTSALQQVSFCFLFAVVLLCLLTSEDADGCPFRQRESQSHWSWKTSF